MVAARHRVFPHSIPRNQKALLNCRWNSRSINPHCMKEIGKAAKVSSTVRVPSCHSGSHGREATLRVAKQENLTENMMKPHKVNHDGMLGEKCS